MTPAHIARNRYDEARAILDAWRARRDRAPHDTDVLTCLEEAAAEHRIALRAWTLAVDHELKAA